MIDVRWVAFLLISVSGPAWADDPAELLARARADFLHGRYEEAAEGYRQIVEHETLGAAAALGLSRCHESTGDWEQAVSVLDRAMERHTGVVDLMVRRGELAFALGQTEPAREWVRRALEKSSQHLPARWLAAQLADSMGDTETAYGAYEWFVRTANERELSDAESLVIAARAAIEHAARGLRARDQSEQLGVVLNTMLDGAIEREPDYWPALHVSGKLFLEKYRKGDALKDLRAALAINANAADVHVALGVAALNDYDIEEGHGHADRALAIHPRLPAARRLKSDLYLAREQFPEAIGELERALEVNATDEETLGRVGAVWLLSRRAGECERLVADVRGRNPRPVTFYTRLAERLEEHRRFDIAETYFRSAIDADARRAGPRTGLGMLFMRVGKEEEATETLEQAFAMDPFNARTKNMLEVLDQLKAYATIETPHFRIKVDGTLDPLLGKYAAKYLEECYTELTETFGYRPGERIQIEIFNKGRGQSAHQWFSARTVGLPWIGTVGACTGKVVAMASPTGLEKPFNWARVLKHEVAHVITLQQTKFQIPHWYTEALAVQTEGYPRPQVWNQLLLQRVPAGQLFDLDDINLAFARPKTQLDWQMAYCQSELYAEYMQTRFGRDSTGRLLHAYAEGWTTTEAVEKTFRIPKSEFESGYLEFLRKLVGELRAVPAETPMTFAELDRAHAERPDDPDLASRLAGEYLKRRNYPRARELAIKATQQKPHHPLGSYVLARLSMLVGDTDRARELLEPALDRDRPDIRVLELLADLKIRAEQHDEAKALYELGTKLYPSESKWVAGQARVALITQDRDRLKQSLEQLSLLDADDPSPRKKLASMAVEDGDWARAAQFAWMTVHIHVADAEAHGILADALANLKQWPQAAEQYGTVQMLRANDPAIVLKRARALDQAGDRAQARSILSELIEQDPQNAAARELLNDFNR